MRLLRGARPCGRRKAWCFRRRRARPRLGRPGAERRVRHHDGSLGRVALGFRHEVDLRPRGARIDAGPSCGRTGALHIRRSGGRGPGLRQRALAVEDGALHHARRVVGVGVRLEGRGPSRGGCGCGGGGGRGSGSGSRRWTRRCWRACRRRAPRDRTDDGRLGSADGSKQRPLRLRGRRRHGTGGRRRPTRTRAPAPAALFRRHRSPMVAHRGPEVTPSRRWPLELAPYGDRRS